jgi:hypothetical protein
MSTPANVDVVFAHHHGDHVPGDRATVDADTGRRLVKGGRAHYATKAEAVAVEGAGGAEKTVRAAKAAAKPA